MYAIINTGEKKIMDKISTVRTGGKISENFQLKPFNLIHMCI